MKGIWLRKREKNSTGNPIVLSFFQSITLERGSRPRCLYSSSFSSSSFLPSHMLVTNSYPSVLHISCVSVTSLSCPKSSQFCSNATAFSLVSPPPPPSTPFLLYTKVFTIEVPTTHRTKSQVLAKALSCLPSDVWQSIAHHSSTQALHSSH